MNQPWMSDVTLLQTLEGKHPFRCITDAATIPVMACLPRALRVPPWLLPTCAAVSLQGVVPRAAYLAPLASLTLAFYEFFAKALVAKRLAAANAAAKTARAK
eukprot:6192563-Pleurochrysis_carterae.AAC.4